MQELVSKLAKQILNKYYGKYRGFVVDGAHGPADPPRGNEQFVEKSNDWLNH